MKKVLSLFLVFVLMSALVCSCAYASTDRVKLSLNGEMKNLVAYNIKDNNYFKLRDLANLLKGTEAEFDVIWNEGKGAIELLTKTPYSTDEELTSEALKNPVATSSYVPIYKDGAVVFLGAYNIADNNYFKLRDVAAVIDFGVDWDEANSVIKIDTKSSYTYPTSSTFGLNTKYLSFFGKTKAEVDSILGEGTYSYEWGMTTYSNDLMVGWNSIGLYPSDDFRAMSMYIPLRELFFACPASLTKEQIKEQFNTWEEGYDEMNEESTLLVNYCGNTLMFFPDYGLTSESYAFINDANPYFNPNTEVIQIINATETTDTPDPSTDITTAYYEYAVAHDGEFWAINQDWRDDREYYYVADVDHDGQREMVVKVGCGVAIYKEIDGKVEQVFYDRLPDSSGSVSYWLASYDHSDYIVYTSANSSEYRVLYVLNNGSLLKAKTSMIVGGDYTIDDASVSSNDYYNYVDNITYPAGMGISGLKNANFSAR